MFIRYIRDWLNGNNVNTGNHWVEIEAIDYNGNNKALNIPISQITSDVPFDTSDVTGNGKSIVNGSIITNGTSGYAYIISGLHNVKLDLGSLYDIQYIKIWHYYADGRIYHNTKTEVSIDNINFITIFDSAKSGTYAESSSGHIILLNNSFLINDNNQIKSTDGINITYCDNFPILVDKFNNGFYLKNINSNIINKLVDQKYNILMLK